MLGSLVPVRHPEEYEQSTIANFLLMDVLMFLGEADVEVEGRYLIVILPPLADAAACMPSQEDWLNDLSLMPPVSVTMQPLNVDVVVVVVDELGLAHPAASRATAASAAPAWRAFLTCYLLFQERLSQAAPPGGLPLPPRTAGSPSATRGNQACRTQTPCLGMIAG